MKTPRKRFTMRETRLGNFVSSWPTNCQPPPWLTNNSLPTQVITTPFVIVGYSRWSACGDCSVALMLQSRNYCWIYSYGSKCTSFRATCFCHGRICSTKYLSNVVYYQSHHKKAAVLRLPALCCSCDIKKPLRQFLMVLFFATVVPSVGFSREYGKYLSRSVPSIAHLLQWQHSLNKTCGH